MKINGNEYKQTRSANVMVKFKCDLKGCSCSVFIEVKYVGNGDPICDVHDEPMVYASVFVAENTNR